jgi:hypothetical protein
MLTRYIGYALVLSALLAVLYYSSGSLLKRTLRCAYVGVFSLVPFLWMLNTWTATSGNRREPLSFIEYASQFTVGTLAWFTSNVPDTNEAALLHYAIVWGPVLLAFILLFILSKKIQVLNPAATFMIGFGVIYTAALFTNALIAYFNRLWGRFQLPDYFPLVILFLLVIGYGSRYLKEHHSRIYIPAAIIGFGFLLFVSTAQLNRTVLLMRDAIQGDIPENGINTGEMNENSIIQYWKANTISSRIIRRWQLSMPNIMQTHRRATARYMAMRFTRWKITLVIYSPMRRMCIYCGSNRMPMNMCICRMNLPLLQKLKLLSKMKMAEYTGYVPFGRRSPVCRERNAHAPTPSGNQKVTAR